MSVGKPRAARLLALLAAGLLMCGCSALGLMAGRSLDAPRQAPIPLEQWPRLRPGEYVEVTLVNGDRWGGRLLALVAADSLGDAPDSIALQVTAPAHSGSIAEPARSERRVIPFDWIARVSHTVPHGGISRARVGLGIGIFLDAAFVAALLITTAHSTGNAL